MTAATHRRTHTLDFYATRLGWKKSELGERPASVQTPVVRDAHATRGRTDPPHDVLSNIPCGGITTSHAPRITNYIRRTGAYSGGARSVSAISKDLYEGRSYGELSTAEKVVVNRRQRHEQKWTIDHIRKSVFAARCKWSVSRPQLKLSGHSSNNAICSSCLDVLNSKQFKTALRVPVPDPKDYKYLNHQYCANDLGCLYARTAGLQDLFEDKGNSEVSNTYHPWLWAMRANQLNRLVLPYQ